MPQTSRPASLALMDMSVLLIVAQNKRRKMWISLFMHSLYCTCSALVAGISNVSNVVEQHSALNWVECAKINSYCQPSNDVRTPLHLKLKINAQTALNNLHKKCNCV